MLGFELKSHMLEVEMGKKHFDCCPFFKKQIPVFIPKIKRRI
jgi:hypothetical protein